MAASILIADDDPVQRRLVENMVQRCGYEAVVVEAAMPPSRSHRARMRRQSMPSCSIW